MISARWMRPLSVFRAPASLYQADARSLGALGLLLLLAQLPHVLHLPVWVSLAGASIIALRWYAQRHPDSRWLSILLAPLPLILDALFGALLIRWQYGYFLGRDPCVAFLFLLVALKYAEIRRPGDATTVMCLAAFLLLTQYFYSQSIIAALVTLPAVLALGHALAVIRDTANAQPLIANLRLVGRLLLQGAPLAVLLFLVFPRLPGPLWSLPSDAGGVTGLSDQMAPGSVSSLSQSDEVAFRVEFNGAAPAPRDLYWRGPVLSEFDGRLWQLSQETRVVTPLLDADQGLGYRVLMQPSNQRWLFALDQPIALPTASQTGGMSLASMSADLQLRSKDRITRVTGYWQRSQLADRFAAMVPPTRAERTVPGRNPRTINLAQRLRASANSDQHFIQLILQRFHEQDYYYTLEPGLLGDRPIDEFLFDTQRGFCEHYASAFVLLARAGGLPARVVTGYLGGEMNGDYMIVRQSDAHAWAEVLIDGHWQRVDPTGAVAPARIEGGLRAALPEAEALPFSARRAPGLLRDWRLRMDAFNHQWQRLVVDFDNDSQDRLWKKLGWPKPALWQLWVLILGMAGAWCALMLWQPRRRPLAREPIERDWQRLCRALAAQGIQRAVDEPPLAYVDRAHRQVRFAAATVAATGAALHRARFEWQPGPERLAVHRTQQRPLLRLQLAGLLARLMGASRPDRNAASI